MRTVKNPDVRKQEILDGAIRVFAKHGYDKATIATIAKELNISQGLCYRYFPSKEDIYHEAIEKYADLLLEEYLRNRQGDRTLREWVDGIGASIGRLLEAETGDPDLYALFHGDNGERMHNELLIRTAAKILPYIQQILKTAAERGELSAEAPEGLAVIGLYGAMGTLMTKGLTEAERMGTIRMGWERLLGLS